MAITCQCPNRCEIHPKYAKSVPAGSAPEAVQNPSATPTPVLAADDKLQLKVLEAESLKAQIEMERTRQQVMQRAVMAHQQLEQFTAAMFEKHGLKQSEWTLDLSRLEFVAREPAKAQ